MNAFARFTRPAPANAARITVDDAVAKAQLGEITILDVRGHDELAASGKAAGALHIPLMLVSSHADPRHPECHAALDTSKPVAVYCASGGRSGMACQQLQQLGYENVHNIGGFGDWVRAGGKTETV